MRPLVLIAMLIATLVYGFMPALAGVMMDAQQAMATQMEAGHHGGTEAGHDDPCPHRGGPLHSAFCAACLAIVPMMAAMREGHPPFSWPSPGAAQQLADQRPAPAEPPPRS